MYEFVTLSKKAERQFNTIIEQRQGNKDKLRLLQEDPRKRLDAHKLKGRLKDFWSCWLGIDLRLVYKIDD